MDEAVPACRSVVRGRLVSFCYRREGDSRIQPAANMTHRTSSSRALFSGVIAVAGALLGLPSVAVASTAITGGNVGNQTWTVSGSPYIISGDITVQSNSTLTIQNGVDVQFKGSDGTHSGVDRVESSSRSTGGWS